MRFLLIFLTAFTLFASEVKWQEDYSVAVEAAKKTNKPIYVFISAGECPWCAKFEKYSLTDKNVIKTLNEHFVALHLVRDFDKIPEIFKTRPVPRHYFLTSKGTMIGEDIGYLEADVFLTELQMVLEEIKK